MDLDPLPASADEKPRGSRPRWIIHLVVLTAYPVVLGLLAGLATGNREGPLLPSSTPGLLGVATMEMLLFGAVFAVACLASRPSLEQLLVRWSGGMRPVARGFVGSLVLRIGLGVALWVAMTAVGIASGGDARLQSIFRPETENLVDLEALVRDPAYFALNLTLTSFVVAGFREELWRAGMLAGFAGVFPRWFGSVWGRSWAVTLTAIVFGLGHLTQGWGGVLASTLLGVGLGMIMLRYRSIWEPALAHGFFNAGSFGMLYIIARWHPEALNTM